MNEPLRDRYHSPHYGFFQNHQADSFDQHLPTGSVPKLNPTAPVDRRRSRASEDAHAAPQHTKGKQRQRSEAGGSSSSQEHGKDPLEIAYGPIVGTNPTITEDDFEVDTTDGIHKPQPTPDQVGEPPREEDSPVSEEAGQWDDPDERGGQTPPTYEIGEDEDEFPNVWR